MKLDHVANRINDEYFDRFVEMLKERLGFQELRRRPWSVHLRQPGANVDLQFSRGTKPVPDEGRKASQISFLSDTPEADLTALMTWADEVGVEASVGAYSDKEFYLDIPEVFYGFVIEAMTPDCADYGPEFERR
jgi:hypothetical protein